MNKEIIDNLIAIVMLMDDLGQSRVSNQTSRLVPQKRGKNITKHIFNINLDVNREISKPNAKRIAITYHLSRWNIQAHHCSDKVGIPEQKVVILTIRRHSTEDLFALIHIKLPELKTAEKQLLVLKPPCNRDRVTQHHTIVHTVSMPWANSPSVRIHKKIWILWVFMPEHPRGAKSIRLVIASLNQLIISL